MHRIAYLDFPSHFEFCWGLDFPSHFEFRGGLDFPSHFEFCGGLDSPSHFEFCWGLDFPTHSYVFCVRDRKFHKARSEKRQQEYYEKLVARNNMRPIAAPPLIEDIVSNLQEVDIFIAP